MDGSPCLYCRRPIVLPPHPIHSAAFCSSVCEASDALLSYSSPSPHDTLAGCTIIPSHLRTHHRAPFHGGRAQPPNPTARRRPRPSFVSAFAHAMQQSPLFPEHAADLSSFSSGSPLDPPQYAFSAPPTHGAYVTAPPHYHRGTTSKRALLPAPTSSTSRPRRLSAEDIPEVTNQLGNVLAATVEAKAAYVFEEEEFEAYGRGHDRAYYADGERYCPLPARGESDYDARLAKWKEYERQQDESGADETRKARPIAIVGRVSDLEARKRWEEQKELCTSEEDYDEDVALPPRWGDDAGMDRPREGDREGRRRESRDRAGGEERGRGRETRRAPPKISP